MEGIELLIHELGIHSTYHGYRYLQYAVSLALQDEDYLLAITKKYVSGNCRAFSCVCQQH